jgi:hypothetical protein
VILRALAAGTSSPGNVDAPPIKTASVTADDEIAAE